MAYTLAQYAKLEADPLKKYVMTNMLRDIKVMEVLPFEISVLHFRCNTGCIVAYHVWMELIKHVMKPNNPASACSKFLAFQVHKLIYYDIVWQNKISMGDKDCWEQNSMEKQVVLSYEAAQL